MKKLIYIFCIIFMGACGQDDSKGSSDAATVIANPLLGTMWKSNCRDKSTYILSYTKDESIAQLLIYDDDACTVLNDIEIATRTYQISLSNHIDVTFKSITWEVKTQAEVNAMNSTQAFGQDWQINKVVDITGKEVSPGAGENVTRAGEILYQIFKIEDGKLYFGATDLPQFDGSELDKRPVAYDTQLVFTKQ